LTAQSTQGFGLFSTHFSLNSSYDFCGYTRSSSISYAASGGESTLDEIEVEHHIGGIKRWLIVVHPLRSRTDHFADDVMETACGLHNFRFSHR
jgi:hypothetical protein